MLNRVTEQLVGDGQGLATQAELDAESTEKTTALNTHNSSKTNVHGVGADYVAKTSRDDQLPAWGDIPDKPDDFTPSIHSSTHWAGGSDEITPADIGAETPAGAQAKADAAEADANTYAETQATAAENNAKSYADTVAATAESNANTYADGKAGTAESNAKSYADTVAATAETDANAYTDSKVTTRFVPVPATATASGNPGDWSADDAYLYVCHAANTWKRVAIATW